MSEDANFFDNFMDIKSYTRQRMAASNRRFCPHCKSVLKYMALGEYKCPECGHEELDDYGKVRRYLDENGPTSAAIIEQDTGVPRKIIDEFLRKGRLEINDNSPVFLKCEICGKDIKFGRICPACAKNKVTKMKGAVLVDEIGEEPIPDVPKTKNGGTMFTRNRFKK